MKKLLLLVLSMGFLFGINGGDCPTTSICFVNKSKIASMSEIKLWLLNDEDLDEKISLQEELKIDDLQGATLFSLSSDNLNAIGIHTITPGATYTITDKKIGEKEGKDVFGLQVWSS